MKRDWTWPAAILGAVIFISFALWVSRDKSVDARICEVADSKVRTSGRTYDIEKGSTALRARIQVGKTYRITFHMRKYETPIVDVVPIADNGSHTC